MAEAIAAVGAVSAVLQLSQAATSLAQALYTFYRSAKNINETVKDLATEVEALGSSCLLVYTLLTRLERDHSARSDDQDGDYKSMWDCVRTQVQECDRTVENLAQCLEGVEKDKGNFVLQSARQIRLNWKKDRIEEFRSRIKLHMACLQIMLQSVNILISNLAPRRADHELLTKIDSLANDVKDLKTIHRQSQPGELISIRHSHTAALRLSQETITSGQKLCRDSMRSGTFMRMSQSVRMSVEITSKVDVDTIRNSSYDSGAESDDDMAVELAEAVSEATREAFDNQEWDETIALVEQLQNGVGTGNMRWSRVEPVQASDLVYMHAMSVFMARDPLQAQHVLEKFTKQKPSSGEQKCQVLNGKYALALTYVRTRQLDLAKTTCNEVIAGRKRLLGRDHEARLHSVALMSFIADLQCNRVGSRIYLMMIPEVRRFELSSMFQDFTPSLAAWMMELSDDTAEKTPSVSEPLQEKLLAGLFPGFLETNESKVRTTIGTEQDVKPTVYLPRRARSPVAKDRIDSFVAGPDVLGDLPLPAKLQLLNLSNLSASTDNVTKSRRYSTLLVPNEDGLSRSTPSSPQLGATNISPPANSSSPPLQSASPASPSSSPRFKYMEKSITLYRGIDLRARERLVSLLNIGLTDVEKAVCRSDLNLLHGAFRSETPHRRSKSECRVNSSRTSKALHLAALFGDVRMAHTLIMEGVDVNANVEQWQLPGKRSFSGCVFDLRETPLHWAVGARQAPMIRFLLENGAVLESQDSCISCAAANLLDEDWYRATEGGSTQEVIETLEVLISMGWNVNMPVSKSFGTLGYTTVHKLLTLKQWPFDHLTVIRFCLESGFDLSAPNTICQSPLEIAVGRNDLEGVSVLLEYISSDLNDSAILVSAVRKFLQVERRDISIAITERLLQAGFSARAADPSGTTALSLAQDNIDDDFRPLHKITIKNLLGLLDEFDYEGPIALSSSS